MGKWSGSKATMAMADRYNLEAYWPVSALEGRFFRTYVFLYDTMDGVREEINSLLGLLERDNRIMPAEATAAPWRMQ